MSDKYEWKCIESGVADDRQGAKTEAEEVAKLIQDLYGVQDEDVRIVCPLCGDDFGKNAWHVYVYTCE